MSESALAETSTYAYPVRLEDAGVGTKRLFIEIPRERIEAKLEEQFGEIRSSVSLPGFRPGHAPAGLVKKKFGEEIKDQVRRQLISESLEHAVTANSLRILGEPEFDNIESLKALPEGTGLSYAVTVEIQPDINLPELKGVAVKRPKISVTEANVDQAMENLKNQQGQFVPVEGEAKPKDFLVGDFHLKLDGNVIGHQHGAQLVVAPGRVGGIEVPELESKLVGLKAGETRVIPVLVPTTHPQPEIAGKNIEIEIKVNDIKRLEPAVIDADFLESLGFADEKELREALREQLVERIDFDIAEAMRNQVRKYLLENINLDLPAKLTQRQSARVVNRRAMDLLQRGIPRQQIEANVAALQQGSTEEAQRELKLFFALAKIAAEREIEVDEEELNGRIAMMAALRGERPEKLKQQMAKDGSLDNLYLQLREQGALDSIIAEGVIEDVEVNAEDASKQAEVGAATAGSETPAGGEHSAT